jgi:oxygen-independent coproporphyrinogen III oxidase
LGSPESPIPRISLYLHVPFCAGKCLYCDFFSVPRTTVSREKEKAVAAATVEQAEFLLKVMAGAPGATWKPGEAAGRAAGSGPRIETLYIGGGTPSVLSPESFAALLVPFRGSAAAEWTVEANPESLNDGFLDACADAGVTRLSLGIQSMQGPALSLLGRPGALHDNERALSLLAARWAGEVSLDFIAGIPGQTAAALRADLTALALVHARHASLYSLTVEPGTGLAAAVQDGTITLNDPDLDEELWFAGRDELEHRGFENYEISNFCVPGHASRHNLRYWYLEPYLGAGPGAVSTLPGRLLGKILPRLGLPDAARAPAVCRLTNPENIDEFLAGHGKLWGMRAEMISPREFLLETLMMGLRLAEGIPAGRLEQRFGRGFEELFPGLWSRWVERGLALPVDGRLRLSDQGRMVLDPLLSEIADRVLDPRLPSPEVSWP